MEAEVVVSFLGLSLRRAVFWSMVLISMYYIIHSWLVPTRAEARGKKDCHYTWPKTCIMQHREASKLDSWLVPASAVFEGKKPEFSLYYSLYLRTWSVPTWSAFSKPDSRLHRFKSKGQHLTPRLHKPQSKGKLPFLLHSSESEAMSRNGPEPFFTPAEAAKKLSSV